MARKCRSGKALAVTRNKCGSAPAVLARRRCACAGLRDCVVFPVADFVFLERSPGLQMARKCRSGKALAVTRNKCGSAPAVLARRRCACAGLRDCVVFPVADFVFLERSPGLQMARKCRSGKALAVTRNKCGSAPAVLARRRCACAGLRDCVVFPIAGFVFLERCPRLQMARKCRSGKALAATRQNDAVGSPDKAQRAAIREESGRDGFAFVEAFLPV